MSRNGQGRVTGHVRLRRGKNGAVWYLRYRLPDGRQRQRRLGDAWEGPGRPPDGYYTRRTAREALDETLVRARNGELPEQAAEREARAEAGTFRAAAREYLRFVEQVRQIDDKTVRDYRGVCDGYLVPRFGDRRLEEITADDIDDFKEELIAARKLSNRGIVRVLTVAHGVFKRAARVHGLTVNPASADLVERPEVSYTGEFDCYTGDQVELLAVHAHDAQDAAIYVAAAYTGLRQGELLGLRWADVDLVDALVHVKRNYTDRRVKVPKGKKVRSVPMASPVIDRLARLKDREHFTGDDDLVFCNTVGDFLDAWALRRRYYRAAEAAGLPRLRFHDLRHVFGSRMAREMNQFTLQHTMGHAHAGTTARYTHFAPRPADAAAIERAFGGDRDKPGGEGVESPDAERDVRGL
jgi:integrase